MHQPRRRTAAAAALLAVLATGVTDPPASNAADTPTPATAEATSTSIKPVVTFDVPANGLITNPRQGFTLPWRVEVPAAARDADPTRTITEVEVRFAGTVRETRTVNAATATGTLTVPAGDPKLVLGNHAAQIVVWTNYRDADGQSTNVWPSTTVHVGDGAQLTYQLWHDGLDATSLDDLYVTAGTTTSFSTWVRSANWSIPLAETDVLLDGTSIATYGRCAGTCTQSTTLRGTWTAPRTVGSTHTLTFRARAADGTAANTLTKTVHVQPAGTWSVTSPNVDIHAGNQVQVAGRLLRSDTGEPVGSGVPVEVRWYSHETGTWTTRGTGATDAGGRYATSLTAPTSGYFQLLTRGKYGTVGYAYAPVVVVTASPRVSLTVDKSRVRLPRAKARAAKKRRTVTFTVATSTRAPGMRVSLVEADRFGNTVLRSAPVPASGKVTFTQAYRGPGRHRVFAMTSRTRAFHPGLSSQRAIRVRRR